MVVGVLSDPDRIDEQFRNVWLPFFCRAGRGAADPSVFDREVGSWPLAWVSLMFLLFGVLTFIMLSSISELRLVVWMVGDGEISVWKSGISCTCSTWLGSVHDEG